MKQASFLFLSLALMLTLAACGSSAGQDDPASDPAPEANLPVSGTPGTPETPPANQPENSILPEDITPEETISGGKKVLIAYFSATGNTAGIAEHLNEILDADLYEIVPETPYTADDLNYNTDCRANQEQDDAGARPAISGSVEHMEQYDVIFLGYPIWWGQAPKIIYTFLESYELSGKTIVPFCTSGSSGIGSSAANLRPLAEAAIWLDGQRFGGGASRSTAEAWVTGLDLILPAAG